MTAVAPPPPPAALTCPGCGRAASPGQRFCVECGRTLQTRYRPASSWRLTAAILTVVLALAGVGAGFGIGSLVHAKKVSPQHVTTTLPAAPVTPPPAATPPAATAPATPLPHPTTVPRHTPVPTRPRAPSTGVPVKPVQPALPRLRTR